MSFVDLDNVINAVRDKYGWDEWAYIEIANDIRDIQNQLVAKIESIPEININPRG